MLKWNWPVVAMLALATAIALTPASAGVNEGFTVAVGGPQRLENPEIGQIVRIPVHVSGLTELKGSVITLHYDPTLVSFVSFDPGNAAPGAQAISGPPVETGDGFVQLDAGASLFGGGVTAQTEGGLLGAFNVEIIAEVPETGSAISVVRVEVNTSGFEEDRDVLDFPVGRRGVSLVRTFPNPILQVQIERRHNGAILTWTTRLPGLDDAGRVRLRGSEDEFRNFESPLNNRFSSQELLAIRELNAAGIDIPALTNSQIKDRISDALGINSALVPNSLVRAVRELDGIIKSRGHVLPVAGLSPQSEYEFQIVSTSLNGKRSNTFTGHFSTRAEPDLRPLFVSDFDLQLSPTSVAASFGTTRPVVTSYALTQVGETDPVAEATVNEDGVTRTRLFLDELEGGVEYEIELTISYADADEAISNGLPAESASVTLNRRFRTPSIRRVLRFLRPPLKIVGSESAQILFETNVPVSASVDYGLVGDDAAKPLQDTEADCLYTWQQESTSTLKRHSLSLSNIDPGTDFRYKITIVTAEGDTLSTDPRGNFQWSRDLRFRTSASADTLPPAIILGPLVNIRDVLAVVRFATDVPTAAAVYIGTDGGTYETEDEYEFADLTSEGERRFSNRHSIIVAGLVAGENYRYRLEVEATNGKVTILEPSLGSGKVAGALQPPGGAGSFTTSNTPDTQFPVILSGPTVTSKTNELAIVEWTTDEPADSEVTFGAESLDDEETSGVTETSHKMTLSSLTAGTSYSYVVGSTDASGNGATESATAVFTTDPEVDLTAPQVTVAPAIIYKNDETATIQWTTDEDATGEVDFGTDESLGFLRTLPTTDKVHEITLTNLTAETTYFFQASSSDLSNNGPTTTDVITFTTDAVADVTLPEISDVAVQAADSTVILTWSTDELADSFVDFGTISGILDVTVGDEEDVLEHEITLTNLSPGVEYFYTVGSIDRSGNGPTESSQLSFATLSAADTEAPVTPADAFGTAGSEQVVLSWTANTELDLAGYNVYRRIAGEETFAAIASRLEETAYTDQGLANDTEYEYQISAIDRETPPNESVVSTTIAVTPTTAAAPTVPSSLSASTGLEPVFSFTNAIPFTTSNSLSYTIQVSTQTDFSDVTVSESDISEGSASTSWTSTRELTEGVVYYWRVRAVEGDLSGPFSETQTFTAEALPELKGDFSGDGAVDFDDFFSFVAAFGKPYVDNPEFDLDGSASGVIDFNDFFAFVAVFGTRSAGKTWAFAHRLDDSARLWLDAEASIMGVDHQGKGNADGIDDAVRVRIWADDVSQLSAFGLVMAYDPHLVEFVDAAEGPGHLLESQGGETGLFSVLHQRPGILLIGNGLSNGEPVGGNGLLAEVSFRLLDRERANDAGFALREAFIARDVGDVRRVMSLTGASVEPMHFALSQAYPNPFNPSTQIEFAIAQDTPTSLTVYDVLGQRVRTLVRAVDGLGAGFYSVTWDGTDHQGRPVGNGLYFYRLATPAFQRTGKMMMIK
ncbi:MAG: T9SS type A sorting domain-containing protein [Gemmatimonadetes bacterium]|jgi:hypothetical protein|nr:T9SS type A sorting domain-containing protein [Gemmatimonadota bacterium]MBT5143192.1 T9SS type A sorting domain-containing protein [Gemmatimonadota bacterium]MBT5586874.1 T9SS type A sorting domain-containing protein [Gemmatimonadota bacterium]MBT5960997.1 T9SS type A sorting domain-containing protein [Gemmatimonadota bacterium]MBT6631011.1 T9SS type A sorting domain-containing protein [Gemmatimonadota bacterium]